MAFYFSRPPGFRHQAGQSLLLTLLDPPETDGEGDARNFTIASAPHEPELMIATRMRDTAFKRVLKTAPIGTTVSMDGPNGEMVLHDDAARPAVFLAGGIGITPFL
ncbi:MAG: FAD-dependent oxidoreductase, partial [Betaproteobacteria bacterium]